MVIFHGKMLVHQRVCRLSQAMSQISCFQMSSVDWKSSGQSFSICAVILLLLDKHGLHVLGIPQILTMSKENPLEESHNSHPAAQPPHPVPADSGRNTSTAYAINSPSGHTQSAPAGPRPLFRGPDYFLLLRAEKKLKCPHFIGRAW